MLLLCYCRRVLVFGGNGFLGASSVERLLGRGHHVTLVNRGNWYWDSETRILPHVQAAISCDRDNGVQSCEQLTTLLDSVGTHSKCRHGVNFSLSQNFLEIIVQKC